MPFAPEVSPNGQPITPPALVGPLDPTAQPLHAAYYYDIYNWVKAGPVVGPSPAGLVTLPPQKPSQPLLVLVSGTGKTGRDSMVNLLLYRIRSSHPATTPIVVEAPLSSAQKSENLKSVANLFITVYGVEETAPSTEDLDKTYARMIGSIGASTDFKSIFTAFNVLVRKTCKRPIVFRMSGSENFDLWSSLYLSLSPLANYVIIETSNKDDALACAQQLAAKALVSHIDVLLLTEQRVRDYVVHRCGAERITAPGCPSDPLAPLTDGALKLLFAPGKANTDNTPVTHPIGWVVETLRRAMDEHVTRLADLVSAQGVTALTAADLRIGENQIRRVRGLMNEGR